MTFLSESLYIPCSGVRLFLYWILREHWWHADIAQFAILPVDTEKFLSSHLILLSHPTAILYINVL